MLREEQGLELAELRGRDILRDEQEDLRFQSIDFAKDPIVDADRLQSSDSRRLSK